MHHNIPEREMVMRVATCLEKKNIQPYTHILKNHADFHAGLVTAARIHATAGRLSNTHVIDDEQENCRQQQVSNNCEFEQDQMPPTEPKEVQEEEEYACAHGACDDQGFLRSVQKQDRMRCWAESKLVLRRTSQAEASHISCNIIVPRSSCKRLTTIELPTMSLRQRYGKMERGEIDCRHHRFGRGTRRRAIEGLTNMLERDSQEEEFYQN
jgi:hypothetical protein